MHDAVQTRNWISREWCLYEFEHNFGETINPDASGAGWYYHVRKLCVKHLLCTISMVHEKVCRRYRGGVENKLKCSAMLHTFRRHTAGCVDDLYAPPDAKFSASLGGKGGARAVALCSRIRTLMYECVRYLQPFTGDTDSCWHNSCELPFGFGQPG